MWQVVADLMVAGFALLTVLGFLGRTWWAFDLTVHFRVQYAVTLTLLALALLLARNYRRATSAGLFALVNLACIAPLYFPAPAAPSNGPTTRAVQLNLNVANCSYDAVWQVLRELQPDLVMVQEPTPRWLKN